MQATDARCLHRTGEYVAVRALSTAISLLVCLGIAVSQSSEGGNLFLVIVAVAAFKGAEAQVDVLYGAMQRLERMDLVAISMTQRGFSGATLFLLVLWLSSSVALAVGALAAMTFLFVFKESSSVRRLGQNPRPEYSGRSLWRLAALGLPLGASVSIGSLTTNVPRFALQWLEGASVLGVFATLAYVLVAAALIGGSASEAAVARLSNAYEAGDSHAFQSTVAKLALFGLCLGLVGTVGALTIGGPLLQFLFGEPYGEYSDVLVILTIGATCQFVSLAVGAAVYAMRLFKVQIPINLAALLVATVSAFYLTSEWGIIGAAWSVVLTQVVTGIAYLFLYMRIRRG